MIIGEKATPCVRGSTAIHIAKTGAAEVLRAGFLWVIKAAILGVTAPQAINAFGKTLPQAIFLQGKDHILGARRLKATLVADRGRSKSLVYPNKAY